MGPSGIVYIPQSAICNLVGDLASKLFKIGNVVEGGTLIFGVAVSAEAKGHFPLNLSFSRMSFPFTMTGLTLDSQKKERDLLHRGILSHLTITGGVTDQTLFLGIFW